MKNDSPLISIVIPNLNGEKFIKNCLGSILLEKGKYEIIVVDDASTDKSVATIKRFLQTQKKVKLIILKKHQGAAAARNIGVKRSRGKYLLFLDNDTKIKKGWFKEAIKFFKKYKNAIAQAKILKMGTNSFDYAGDYLSHFGFLVERARGSKDKGQFNKVCKIFALKSAALLSPKKIFQKIGGFDKDFQIFWEDTDFAWRAWLLGYKVLFYPFITVEHAYGTKQKSKKIYLRNQVFFRGCRNNITSLIKNLETKNLFLILPVNLSSWVVLGLLFLIRLDFFKSLSIFRGILTNLFSLPYTLKKRKIIQNKRKINDGQLFSLVGTQRNIFYYLGKAWSYLNNKPF